MTDGANGDLLSVNHPEYPVESCGFPFV